MNSIPNIPKVSIPDLPDQFVPEDLVYIEAQTTLDDLVARIEYWVRRNIQIMPLVGHGDRHAVWFYEGGMMAALVISDDPPIVRMPAPRWLRHRIETLINSKYMSLEEEKKYH